MRFWNDYPLLRLLIPMLMGILIAYYFSFISLSIIVVIIALLVVSLWFFRTKRLRQFNLRMISGILVSALFLLIGIQLVRLNQKSFQQNHYSRIDSISHLLIKIESPLLEKKNSFKTIGQIIAVYKSTDSRAMNANGQILIYFEKASSPSLEYGDELLISIEGLQDIKNMGNPNEFDYKAYLNRQNIYHQIYLTKTDWLLTSRASPNFLKKMSYQVRGVLLEIIRALGFESAEFAVASAILLGYDEYLDPDLQQLYSGSGAMHILCVSGLHVGIIFMIFNLLFAPLRKVKYGQYLTSILLLLIIWFYALITGMSPSVFRAATMFSFISIGKAIARKTSTYNSLIASAMVLLLSDPFLIFHIGFQLSYMAVLAILVIQPMLSGWVDSKYSLLRKIRDLISVSIAAQMGTFPLAIYYFHQFPNYFILTNLVVIPLSFMILISGFFTLTVFLMGIGTTMIGVLSKGILYALLLALNSSISFISQLPLAVSTHLYFTAADVFLIYLMFLFLLLAIFHRVKKYAYATLITTLLLMVYNVYLRYPLYQQAQITIYNIPKASLIEISEGRACTLYLDSATKASDNYHRYISGHHYHQRINSCDIKSIDSIGFLGRENELINLIKISGKSLFIIDEKVLIPGQKTPFNYVLLRENPRIPLTELKKYIDFDTLIWDQSNKFWRIKTWTQECDSLNIPYFDTHKKGAFIIKGS